MLVYEIITKSSFSLVTSYYEMLKNECPEALFFLIGNKVDLDNQRTVSKEQGEQFATENDMMFFETSEKTYEHVNEAFMNPLRHFAHEMSDGIRKKNVEKRKNGY